MRPAHTVIVILLVVSPLVVVAPTTSADTITDSWMIPGFILEFEGTPTASAGLLNGPPAPIPITVIVHDVTPTSITLDWVAASGTRVIVQQATYDRATRSGSSGYSFLWVTPDDIAQGSAWLGDRPATLVTATPAGSFWSAGGQSFLFDARGLLVRADDLDTGSALVAVGEALGVPPPVLSETSPTVPAETLVDAPLIAVDSPLDDGSGGGVGIQAVRTFSCSGTVSGVLGGSQERNPCGTFNVWGDFQVGAQVGFPLLGSGSIRSTHRDILGDYLIIDCTSFLPATSSGSVVCTHVFLRNWVLIGPHSVRVRATFGYCLNPLTLFSCPWSYSGRVSGSVS